MFERDIVERNTSPGMEDVPFLHDTESDRTFVKIVGGVCPPNMNAPGYIVVAGLEHPFANHSPNIWLMGEGSFSDLEDLLLAMSRAHFHYKLETHYCRFKRSKGDDRVYDDFLRHVQRFNLEAIGVKRSPIVAQDAPWTNDKGHLKFILEKVRSALTMGKRQVYWFDPAPPSTNSLNGVDEWENTKDDDTMLGAFCYAIAGLLVDKPHLDRLGRVDSGLGVKKTVGKFDPYAGHRRMMDGRN
jgi:hypothetical protein